MDNILEATFEQVPCIQYSTTFLEKSILTQKVRSMPYTLSSLRNWAFGSDQALFRMFFDIKVQKIDGITLDTYGMIVVAFLMMDKANQSLICLSLP